MNLKRILLLWISWILLVIGFQWVVTNRFFLVRPDTALSWTVFETSKHAIANRPYLIDQFMNDHVAWDSEFYLAIADKGYDNPDVRLIYDREGNKISLNYAFFPFYPVMIKLVSFLLFNLTGEPFLFSRIAVLTLAAVIVSALGALLALFSLYLLLKKDEEQDDDTVFRTLFFFLIFPSSFFMLQVYTEGLFAGLAFASLASLRYRKFWLAALFAVFAVWTRAVGCALIVAIGWELLREFNWKGLKERKIDWKTMAQFLWLLLPAGAFLAWRFSWLGRNFEYVEKNFFGRGTFNIIGMFEGWRDALIILVSGGNMPTRIYYGLEFSAVVLGIASCIALFKKHAGTALFGLTLLIIAISSGAAQSLVRYVLPVATIYLYLGKKSENKTFERAWTLASILLLGMETILYSHDFFVG